MVGSNQDAVGAAPSDAVGFGVAARRQLRSLVRAAGGHLGLRRIPLADDVRRVGARELYLLQHPALVARRGDVSRLLPAVDALRVQRVHRRYVGVRLLRSHHRLLLPDCGGRLRSGFPEPGRLSGDEPHVRGGDGCRHTGVRRWHAQGDPELARDPGAPQGTFLDPAHRDLGGAQEQVFSRRISRLVARVAGDRRGVGVHAVPRHPFLGFQNGAAILLGLCRAVRVSGFVHADAAGHAPVRQAAHGHDHAGALDHRHQWADLLPAARRFLVPGQRLPVAFGDLYRRLDHRRAGGARPQRHHGFHAGRSGRRARTRKRHSAVFC